MKFPVLLFCISIAASVLTAVLNPGFVALDDYADVLHASVPAQRVPGVDSVIDSSGLRSPIPRLIIFGVAKTAYHLGFHDPLNQVRFIYICLGLFSSLSLLFGWGLFQLLRQQLSGSIVIALMGLHFLSPYLATRALIESMAAPFLTMSLFFLCRYWVEKRLLDLVLSVCWLSIASAFRFQAGTCILAWPIILYLAKRPKHFWPMALTGIAAFLATGWVDLILRGRFHDSLIRYVTYNVEFSAAYGVSSAWSYLLLFLGISFFPCMISRYRGFRWKAEYYHLLPVVLAFVSFLVSHSAVGHKEPRFMTTALPLFWILMTPLVRHLLFPSSEETPQKIQRATKKTWALRIIPVGTINVVLLVLTSCFPAQNNVIGVMRYFHETPTARMLVNYAGSVVLFPSALTLNVPERYVGLIGAKIDLSDCSHILAVRKDYLDEAAELLNSLTQVAAFKPGPLEQLIIYLQPDANMRRAAVYLYRGRHCTQ